MIMRVDLIGYNFFILVYYNLQGVLYKVKEYSICKLCIKIFDS